MKKYILILFLLSLGISSCVSKKDIVYLQNDEIDRGKISNDYQLRFKPDDFLQIIVSAENLESVLPFKLLNAFLVLSTASRRIWSRSCATM